MFTGAVFCARPCAGQFTCLIPFESKSDLGSRHYYLNTMDQNTKA